MEKVIKTGFWLFGFYVVGFMLFGYEINSYKVDNTTKTDAIVVLTGGRNRIKAGLDLIEKGMAGKIFVSGVQKNVSIQELKRRKDLEINGGIDIELGNVATTTFENGLEVKDWVSKNNIKSLRLVTSNYHLPRAMLEIEAQNKDVIIIENPIKSEHVSDKWWKSFSTFYLIFKEYNKFLYVFVRNLI